MLLLFLAYWYHTKTTTPANTARMHVKLTLRYCDHPSATASAIPYMESLNTAGNKQTCIIYEVYGSLRTDVQYICTKYTGRMGPVLYY